MRSIFILLEMNELIKAIKNINSWNGVDINNNEVLVRNALFVTSMFKIYFLTFKCLYFSDNNMNKYLIVLGSLLFGF